VKSKAQVIADARHARDSASSYLVNGVFGPTADKWISVHLWVSAGNGEAGSMSTNLLTPHVTRHGGSFDVRVIGTDLYLRGDLAKIPRRHGSPPPPKGIWLKASTTSGPVARLYALIAPAKLFPILDSDPTTLTDRGWDTMGDNNPDNHAEVIVDAKDGGEMRVRAHGTPYPDSMTWDDEGNELEFSNWNAPVPISPPKGAVPASRYGLG
jgi:hypothetical protein